MPRQFSLDFLKAMKTRKKREKNVLLASFITLHWVKGYYSMRNIYNDLCFDLEIFGSKGQIMINFEIYTSSKCDSCTQSLFN